MNPCNDVIFSKVSVLSSTSHPSLNIVDRIYIFNCIGGGSGAALKALLNDMICYMFINPAGDSFTFLFIFFGSFIKPCIQNPCVQHSHFNVNVSLNFTPCGSKLCWWRLKWIQVMLCEGSARLYIQINDLVQSFFFSPSPTSPSRQYRSLDRTAQKSRKGLQSWHGKSCGGTDTKSKTIQKTPQPKHWRNRPKTPDKQTHHKTSSQSSSKKIG